MKIRTVLMAGVVSAAALLAQTPVQAPAPARKSAEQKSTPRKRTVAATPQPARPAERARAPRRIVTPIHPAANTANVAPLEIPKDAKQLDARHYRVVDAQGVAWLYTKTPFGIMRGREDDGAHADPEPANTRKETATVEGDHVRFVLITPFGKNIWTKKMSELTDEDRKVLKGSPPAPPATAGAERGKD